MERSAPSAFVPRDDIRLMTSPGVAGASRRPEGNDRAGVANVRHFACVARPAVEGAHAAMVGGDRVASQPRDRTREEEAAQVVRGDFIGHGRAALRVEVRGELTHSGEVDPHGGSRTPRRAKAQRERVEQIGRAVACVVLRDDGEDWHGENLPFSAPPAGGVGGKVRALPRRSTQQTDISVEIGRAHV